MCARSRFCLRSFVPSLPRRSKSKSRMTSLAPVCSISCNASSKDLPPVFKHSTGPATLNLRSALTSFFPSTTMGIFLADSSTNASKTCWIFSSFSVRRVDKGGYLVILALRMVSKHSLAELLQSKYLLTGSNMPASCSATPFFKSCGCSFPSL